MNGFDEQEWKIEGPESIWIRSGNQSKLLDPIPLVVLLRVRDEELILEDTLNHLANFVDVICAYDDASSDKTREILKSHEKVFLVVQNDHWQPGFENRLLSETRHRGLLLQECRKRFSFNWCMCCDADERYFGEIRQFVTEPIQEKPDSIRIRLFDAYMTEGDDSPFSGETPLTNFRRYFGPECRDILMLWKNGDHAYFTGLDSREPLVHGHSELKFFCQHYGKSLSYEHWEDTCEYYVTHFPFNSYGEKWAKRRGKAVHSKSDFGRSLFEWGDNLFENAVRIY
jgi:glycosyltransferase involved in cell wall biosynthesis